MGRRAWRYRVAARLLGGKPVAGTVSTRMELRGTPETVWRHLVLFEELPQRAPLALRLWLPEPLGTEGNKDSVGALVWCTYRQGTLMKQVTRVEAPSRLEFEVVGQRLGLESCVEARGGAYGLRAAPGGATEVELTTRYRGRLRPRWLWRRVEAALAHRLHRHILGGIAAAVSAAPAEKTEEKGWPASSSRSRRSA